MTLTVTSPSSELIEFAPGVIDKYNTDELDQITVVRQCNFRMSKARSDWQCEVVRLKLLLDRQDEAEGVAPGKGNDHAVSRFWDGARSGDFGDALKEMADNGNRMTVNRWQEANDAATKLLGSGVTHVTPALPLQSALEQGFSFRVLDAFSSAPEPAQESLRLLLDVDGGFSQRHVEYITRLHSKFSDRVDELNEGILAGAFKRPHTIADLMDEWETQRREQEAREQALAEAAALQEAEKNEDEAESYEPEVESEPHIGDQPKPEDVTVRRSPSKAWYQSPTGKSKVEEVVGDLGKPLSDLISSLAELSKRLDDQFAHSSQMHNYAEFWAGYDRFFYTESTHRCKWGRSGRLERMKKLRSQMREIAGKLDVYISASTPPEEIEYPEV